MSKSVRFYMDEHVHPAVAAGLRRRGIDVLTTQEVDMLSASDEEHLIFAQNEGRVIFTQDEDFLRIHARGHAHAGIVYARQRTSIGYIVRSLVLVFEALTADEMRNWVEYI